MKTFRPPLGKDALAAIAECLDNGGIVLMPTDTVYGIAALPSRHDAIARIVAAKGRDAAKPIPLLAGGVEAVAASHLLMSASARKVASRFWPGALTLVIDRQDGGTEGVRVPDDATARAICSAAGGMLRCTSANESGDTPALDAEAAAAAIPTADILVDGGRVRVAVSSTVVKVTDTDIHIFREGPVTLKDIQDCIG